MILDFTPNTSHTEQMTVVIKNFMVIESKKKIELCKHLVEFCPITDSTGK